MAKPSAHANLSSACKPFCDVRNRNPNRWNQANFSWIKNKFDFWLEGRRLALTSTEFKLLTVLIARQGRTQSRETLLRDVWGYQNPIDTRTVDTHVRRLREKLGTHALRLETVRGEGYRFNT